MRNAIDWCRGVANPILDDLDSSRHNVSGPSTRQEAMVRCSGTRNNIATNIAAADVTTVKVPEMAESITEGTLKQWSKREDTRRRGARHMLTKMQRSATTLSRTRRLPPSRPTRSTFP